MRYGLSGKYKFKLDADYKEIILHSPDNESLHAIHMYVEEPKGLLIYFHGNAEDVGLAMELLAFVKDMLKVSSILNQFFFLFRPILAINNLSYLLTESYTLSKLYINFSTKIFF